MIDHRYRENLAFLETDDVKRRPKRATRLAVFDHIFEGSSIRFLGGRDSFNAYRELRSAFVDGLYQATVLLTLSCVEKELGAKLFARGVTDAGDFSIGSLCRIACALNEIGPKVARQDQGTYPHRRSVRRFSVPYQGHRKIELRSSKQARIARTDRAGRRGRFRCACRVARASYKPAGSVDNAVSVGERGPRARPRCDATLAKLS
jgi:hypothetical protein